MTRHDWDDGCPFAFDDLDRDDEPRDDREDEDVGVTTDDLLSAQDGRSR